MDFTSKTISQFSTKIASMIDYETSLSILGQALNGTRSLRFRDFQSGPKE